jgi:hypothetical protein
LAYAGSRPGLKGLSEVAVKGYSCNDLEETDFESSVFEINPIIRICYLHEKELI